MRFVSLFDLDFKAFQNEYFWFLDNRQKTHLFQYKDDTLFPIHKSEHRVKPRNLEQRAALDLLMDSEIELVALLGKAGTGKTYLALASALEQTALYHRILLSKPVVDVGKGIGFPSMFYVREDGALDAEFLRQPRSDQPYVWDTSPIGMEAGSKETFLEKNQIEIQPIHSIRGRSLKQAYMIIDEAQNLTKHEIKSIITRAAEGTKVVLLGDPYQVDHPYLDTNSNGLVYVIEKDERSVDFWMREPSQVRKINSL